MRNAFLLLCIILPGSIFSQIPDADELGEALIQQGEVDADYEALYEYVSQLYNERINLNTANRNTLDEIYLLSEKQKQNLLKHIEVNGKLLSIYELQSIDGFSPEEIKKLSKIIQIDDAFYSRLPGNTNQRSPRKDSYILTRISRRYLETDTSTQNEKISPAQLYLKFRSAETGDYSMGLSFEKDASEPMVWKPEKQQFGFDFSSFHLQFQNRWKFKNIIIGDYSAQFGQGLTLGGGFSLGKGAETITSIRQVTRGFIPYTSTREYGFYRGCAITFALLPHLYISSYYSFLPTDAHLSGDGQYFTSLLTSGLHRTPTEQFQHHIISTQSLGSVIHFEQKNGESGIIFSRTSFSLPFLPDPTPYNQFAFRGSSHSLLGYFYNHAIRNFNIFSEGSQQLGAGRGFLAGIIGAVGNNVELSLLLRSYDPDFISFQSSALSESSRPQNERGVYWGWKYKPTRLGELAGYMDMFSFPWLKFRQYRPSTGHEWMVRYSLQPVRSILLNLQFTEESKIINVESDVPDYTTAERRRRTFRFNTEYPLNDNIILRSRLQLSNIHLSGSQSEGIAIAQDVIANFRWIKVSARHAIFDTDNYDTRQYMYENDAWLSYSLPAYYGTGIRDYILIEVKAGRHFTFWFRGSRTKSFTTAQTTSGEGKVEANTENDIKFQALFNF